MSQNREKEVTEPGDRRSSDHNCGWGAWLICEEQVHVASRQFHILRIPKEEGEPKTKRGSRDEVATRPYAEPDTDDAGTKVHG